MSASLSVIAEMEYSFLAEVALTADSWWGSSILNKAIKTDVSRTTEATWTHVLLPDRSLCSHRFRLQ